MTSTQQSAIEDVRSGDVVRFTPTGRRNRVTVLISHCFDGVGVGGHRAQIEGNTVITRGELSGYFVSAGSMVEVLRSAPRPLMEALNK